MVNLSRTVVSGLRRAAKALVLQFLFCTGLLRWARTKAAKRGVVVITLHRVLPDEQYDVARLEPGMAVRASTFRRLLEYLTQNCKPVLPGEAITSLNGKTSRTPRILLTFDDGWKDNFETAFPLSQQYATPFTVFLCPQVMDGRNGFWTTTLYHLWRIAHDAGKLDLIHALSGERANGTAAVLIESLKHVPAQERERFITELQHALAPYITAAAQDQNQLLTWADVKAMANAGIAFGSHTNTHAILTDISAADAARELTESKSAIEAQLSVCPWFAYPNGDWSQSVRDLAERAGYQAAFANSPGIWEQKSNKFSIPRINVWEGSLVDRSKRFSRIALEYSIFWKACWARRQPA